MGGYGCQHQKIISAWTRVAVANVSVPARLSSGPHLLVVYRPQRGGRLITESESPRCRPQSRHWSNVATPSRWRRYPGAESSPGNRSPLRDNRRRRVPGWKRRSLEPRRASLRRQVDSRRTADRARATAASGRARSRTALALLLPSLASPP